MSLTGGFACTSIRLQLVSVVTGASERATFIVAGLTAEARDQTLVYVIASLRIIQQLESWFTGALSSKRTLNTTMTAAPVICLTVISI